MRRWLRRLTTVVLVLLLLFLVGAIYFRAHTEPIAVAFAPTPDSAHHPAIAAGVANYIRPEQDTFYTYPEWYIVWSYQAKADYQRNHLPSGYPYFGDVAQYWRAYSLAYAATRKRYPFAGGDHLMLVVIGSSFSVEYALKGLYEKTFGWLSEKTAHGGMVAEDAYAAQVNEDYASFVHVRPFYEYSFWRAFTGLWREVPFHSIHAVRSIERRAWLSLDYGIESLYCELIELATHLTYGYEDTTTAAWIDLPEGSRGPLLAAVPHLQIKREQAGQALVEVPRYQEFTSSVSTMIDKGVVFHQIAGNELIALSAVAPAGWNQSLPSTQLLLVQPVLSDPAHERIYLLCRVSELHQVVPALQRQGVKLEHLYDY